MKDNQKMQWENKTLPEHSLLQTAFANALRISNPLIPDTVSLDTIEDSVTTIIDGSDMTDWKESVLDVTIRAKLLEGNLPYIFWDIVLKAFQIVLSYIPCKMEWLILEDDMKAYLDSKNPIVTKATFTHTSLKDPFSTVITVTSYENDTVYFTDPQGDPFTAYEEKNKLNGIGLSMPFSDFWNATDVGCNLHYAAIFTDEDICHSPLYTYNSKEYITAVDILPVITSDYEKVSAKYDRISKEGELLCKAGADITSVGKAIQSSSNLRFNTYTASIYQPITESLLSFIYPKTINIII